MAVTNHSEIFIDGEELFTDVTYSVEIAQVVGAHHQFSVVIPISSLEGFASTLMDESIHYIGKKISIYFTTPIKENKLEFVGIIDDISLQKTDASTGKIKISGKSPDVLLSNRYDCRSFSEDSVLSDVISTVCGGYDSKILSSSDSGKLTENLPYTVQYNETDYNFINRMCNHYGHWLYYNGTSLCLGLTDPQEIEATYGVEINQFGIHASLNEQVFSINQYDWINNTEHQAMSSNSYPEGNHSYIDLVKQASDDVYATEGYYHLVHGQTAYGGQDGIDQVSKSLTLGKASSLLMASGASELPNIRLGDTLKIKGVNFENHTQKDAYGSYSIIEIVHRFKSSGEYSNHFSGVPKGTTYISPRAIFSFPKATNQRAKVVDNIDPEGLGRVKVKFPWQRNGDETTPWIKMATPYAGADKGFYFIPEIDEEVLIGFEDGNAERPFVLSAGFNQAAKSNFDKPDNNLKVIRTRSGHTVEFNDEDGAETIKIYDNEGSIIVFDTQAKSLTINATETMDIAAKNINIIAEENIKIQAKGDIEMASEGDTKILSEGDADMQSKGDTSIAATGDAKLTSKGEIAVEATQDVNIKGMNAKLEGQTKADLKGMQTSVSGQMTAIKGASGKIDVM